MIKELATQPTLSKKELKRQKKEHKKKNKGKEKEEGSDGSDTSSASNSSTDVSISTRISTKDWLLDPKKDWPKVAMKRAALPPHMKITSLRDSFRLLDDWTKAKKRIEVSRLSASAPEIKRPPKRLKRTLSWHLQNSWDYEPFYYNVEKWKMKVAKMQNLPAGNRLSILTPSDLEQISHMPTDWTTSTYVTDLSDDEDDLDKAPEEEFPSDAPEPTGSIEWKDFEESWKKGLKLEERKIQLEPEKYEMREVIVAGTTEALLSCLADLRAQDTTYIEDFLFSYRAFLKQKELLDFLMQRFYFLPPKDASTEIVKLHHKYAPIIQLRVINVLFKWVRDHFYDFERDEKLLSTLNYFIEGSIKATHERWYPKLKALILEKELYGTGKTLSDYGLSTKSDLPLIEAAMQHDVSGVPCHILRKGKTHYKYFKGDELLLWLRKNLGDIQNKEQAKEFATKLVTQKVIVSARVRYRETEKFASNRVYRFAQGGTVSGKIPDPRVPRTIRDRSWSFDREALAEEMEREKKRTDMIKGREKEINKEKEKEKEKYPPSDLKPATMMDIHPVELARQLTLYSDSLFRAITPDEFMKSAFTERRDQHLVAYSNRYSMVSNWVVSEVLSQPNPNKRAAVMRRLIAIADACYNLNNFFDTAAIIAGFYNPSVSRLKQTWKKLSKEENKLYKRIDDLVQPMGNFKELRNAQRKAKTPVIPLVAIYTSDLEHLSEIPNVTQEGMLNFHKRRIEASVFKEMASFKAQKYLLIKIPEIYDWVVETIDSTPVFDSATQFAKSLEVEPRTLKTV